MILKQDPSDLIFGRALEKGKHSESELLLSNRMQSFRHPETFTEHILCSRHYLRYWRYCSTTQMHIPAFPELTF